MYIDIPAKDYVELLKAMDDDLTGYDAADRMHRILQCYMGEGSIDEYIQEYYKEDGKRNTKRNK